MTNAICESFATYLRTIQKRWRESKKEASIQLHNKVKNRRQVRKYQLFHQRRYLAYVFAPLRKHADMLEQFGVDGMSSDESEVDEEGVISFQSHMPAWRAEIVTIWLHLFDVLHSMLRKTSLGPKGGLLLDNVNIYGRSHKQPAVFLVYLLMLMILNGNKPTLKPGLSFCSQQHHMTFLMIHLQ
ncbi:hypothetical protein MIND_00229500 [Mycena indigotica]|uniref:Uncharacterized protein n=1 Tax=Mycena indigotica TaxID=2126181 RepID=A0A8H6WET0_9AGAR|nr:uncharacterized protein MIND_00229500 [Mycena indigotica]KAF7312168.1 hypothetical protein MIND_00229500 [Mycena indigotica]